MVTVLDWWRSVPLLSGNSAPKKTPVKNDERWIRAVRQVVPVTGGEHGHCDRQAMVCPAPG
jgi:hypothetical protein